MTRIDWGPVGTRPPTRKELALYRNWVRYLRSSKLNEAEVQRRAKDYAEQHRPVPKEDT